MPRADDETPWQREIREAVERYTSTPEWKAMKARHDAEEDARIGADPALAERVARYQEAAAPVIADLRAAGLGFTHDSHDTRVQNLDVNRQEYKRAEPILLHWLEQATNGPVAFELAGLLSRSDASRAVAPVVVRVLRRWCDRVDADSDLVCQVLAGVLRRVPTHRVIDDVLDLAGDPNTGVARANLAMAVAKIKDPRADVILDQMLDEPNLQWPAAKAMGHRRSAVSRHKIERLLFSSDAEMRKVARKALRRINEAKKSPDAV